ncbi:hypothetical protein [Bauldia sp.]|uniref:hypothetical protein n=1 Tax=Bauldia sp. TaxID=2575872 RepID=UPI003BA98F8A
MPKQKTDLFVPTGPAIEFSQPNQIWRILEGITVAVGEDDAIISHSPDGTTLINKGFLLGGTNTDGAAGFSVSDSVGVAFENRKTGYVFGSLGVALNESDAVSLVNDGDIFGALNGVSASIASNLTIENHGTIDGTRHSIRVDNGAVIPGPVIKNFGTLTSAQETISLAVADATATIKNKPGGLIENTGDGRAIWMEDGTLKLINKGTIIGRIEADLGNDTLLNEGTITGNVSLGNDNDVYKNKGGKVDGRIDSGNGNDKLVLGNSKDRIEFDDELNAATNVDRVKNFESGKDKFFLDASDEFFGLTLGTLQKSEFTRGTEAKGGSAQLVYDKPSGQLWLDGDGVGGNGKTLFAELDDNTALKHDDFTVYA